MRRFWPVFAVALLLTEATACSAIWGFEDGTLGALDGAGEPDATASSSGNVVDSDAALADAETEAGPPPPGCTERKIVPTGFFVTPSGDDITACGTSNTPCKTLGFLLTTIRDGAGDPRIHVGRGVYVENVDIDAQLAAKGLTLEGEWEVRLDGANRQWLPVCTDVQNGRTFVVGSGNGPTLRVAGTDAGDAGTDAGTGSGASVTLSYLQIRSRGVEVPGYVDDEGKAIVSPPAAGESLYGVHVSAASLSVSNSSIVVARGGDGVSGAEGAAGSSLSPVTCNDDEPGPNGTAGADAPASTCQLGSNDFVCTDADAAQPGTAGVENSCLLGSCRAGGSPGGPGRAGGSSVAIFLAARSSARVEGTTLITGGGGTGGNGGTGGAGGQVSPATCTGSGGRGGYGSPAPGGASFCIARLPQSTVEYLDTNTCTFGAPGAGGSSTPPAPAPPINAAPGPSGDIGP